MKFFIKNLIFPVAVLALSLAVFPAAAQFDYPDTSGLGIAKGTKLKQPLIDIIDAFLGLSAVVAAAFVIYGGIKYMMSAGDEKGATAGKNAVIYAMIGLVVIGLAAVLVNFVISNIPK